MVLRVILLTLPAIIQLFPLLWLIDFSLCESSQLFGSSILVWPDPPQWGNYYQAIFQSHFLLYLKNSVLINTLSIFLVVVFSMMCAFACTRMEWKLRGAVSILLLLGLMIPPHATILPNYLVFSKLKLADTICLMPFFLICIVPQNTALVVVFWLFGGTTFLLGVAGRIAAFAQTKD